MDPPADPRKKEKKPKKDKEKERNGEHDSPDNALIEPIPPPDHKKASDGGRKASKGNIEAIQSEVPSNVQLPGDLSVEDLVKLTELPPDPDRAARLKSYGGVMGVAKILGSNPKTGLPASELTPEALALRKSKYGANEYPPPIVKSLFELWVEALQDKIIIILAIAAAVSIILGTTFPPPGEAQSGWIEGVAIILAILAVTGVSSINNWTKELKFRELTDESRKDVQVTVVRDGVVAPVSAFHIVVGDVIELNTGSGVPGDGLYIQGTDLESDESAMTGESLPVRKSAEMPYLLSGCTISDGNGRMVVTSVGSNSEWGRTMAKLAVEMEDTPMQIALEDLAEMIGWVGIGVAGLVFTLLTLYWVIDVGTADAFYKWNDFVEILQFFIIGVTVIVVAVPEGLPLAVTICLAYSVRAMMKDKNLVRHLDACEVMGGCTNICSDKTGTLTENRMSVVAGWVATSGWKEGETWDRNKVSKDVFGMLTEGICTNSKANINKVEGQDQPQFVGNPTECAMLTFLEKNDVNYRSVRDGNHAVHMYPFKSARKRMSCVIEAGDTGYRLHCKGASEMILRLCTHYMEADGTIIALNPDVLAAINSKIDDMANQSLRTLGVAYRDFAEPLDWPKYSDKPPEDKLTFIAVLGILDPLRQGVPEAVRTCQNAGVMVRMVTGDNLTTAKKIAEQCGIYNPKNGGVAIEGPEFARIYKNNPEDVDAILPNLQVLARSSPTDKYNLVKRLRKNGQIVAVTGDGTNDAPALKKAHVGLAMGIAGTEVAKFAADIIIMDDNFTSIVKTVMWGRSVFDNVRKFLQFQLTVNLAALMIVLIGAASKQGTPLQAVQLLWVNLIMDTFAALALATEKPTERLLHRLPINIRQARFISNKMLKHIAGQAVYQVAILLIILYIPGIFKVKHLSDAHYGAIFNVFVWMQIFNEINSRKINDELNVLEGFFTNWIFLGVILVTIVGQVIIVEFGSTAFHTAHQSWWQWLLSIAFGATTLVVGFFLRLIPTNDKVQRTPYNVELSPEKLAKRLKKSVSKPNPNKAQPAAASAAPEGDKKNDLEV